MVDRVDAPITYDDIPITSYEDFDEAKAAVDPLMGKKAHLVNAGIPQDTVRQTYDDTIENVVGSPKITNRFSHIEAPDNFNLKNSRIFNQSTLIQNLNRENLLDVDMNRIDASNKLTDNDKEKVTNMLKTVEELAKLQQTIYFETKRYSKG